MAPKTIIASCVGVAIVVAAVVIAILHGSSLQGTTVDSGPAITAETTPAGAGKPGGVVSSVRLDNLVPDFTSAGVQAARVVYHSTEGDTGALTTVSGSVFTPAGSAPRGGWPVVAFGHGTTGFDENCAPSASPTLLNLTQVVGDLIKRGYAVTLPDYQGLGEPGVHPYLDARTAGLNLIDSVRALRATFPQVSNRWAVIGQSQGGGATWAADEQSATYAPDLDLVGAVAVSPPADMTGLVKRSQDGSLTVVDAPALQAVLVSLGRLHPDFDLDDYRRGSVARNWRVLSSCAAADRKKRAAAIKEIGPGELAPSTPKAARILTKYLQDWALPQKKLGSPLLVAYGGKDLFVPPSSTTAAIAAACRLGGTIQADLMPDKGHSDIDPIPLVRWIADRFAGEKATSTCP